MSWEDNDAYHCTSRFGYCKRSEGPFVLTRSTVTTAEVLSRTRDVRRKKEKGRGTSTLHYRPRSRRLDMVFHYSYRLIFFSSTDPETTGTLRGSACDTSRSKKLHSLWSKIQQTPKDNIQQMRLGSPTSSILRIEIEYFKL